MLAIRVEGIGMEPEVEVSVERFHNGKTNYTTLVIGGITFELSESKLDEIREKIDSAIWDETKESLEAKVEELEAKIDSLEEALDEAAYTHDDEVYECKQSWFV
jgi:ABC-type phosphate transport system auxiliary subunit